VERLEVRHNSLFEPTIPVEEPATPVLEILYEPHKQAPAVGGESQAQFLPALFNAIAVPLVISRSSDGTILYANAHFYSTFGLATEEKSQEASSFETDCDR
jgi:hypothetical protein